MARIKDPYSRGPITIEIVASRNEACRFRNVNSRDRFSEPNDDSAIFEIAATFFRLRHGSVLFFLKRPTTVDIPPVEHHRRFATKNNKPRERIFKKNNLSSREREKNSSEKRNVHLSREEQSFSIVVKRVRSFDPRPGCKNCGVSAPRKWLRSRIIGQSGNCASTGYDAFFRAYRASHHHRTCQ